jgi:hypothetical protein
MKSYRVWRVLKVVLMVAVAVNLFGWGTECLWNWLMPAIFGLRSITFAQAIGLLVLSKILFGGFHRHGGGGRGWRRGWRKDWEERWAKMSPEEQQRFRAGMRGRGRCGFGPLEETEHEQAKV